MKPIAVGRVFLGLVLLAALTAASAADAQGLQSQSVFYDVKPIKADPELYLEGTASFTLTRSCDGWALGEVFQLAMEKGQAAAAKKLPTVYGYREHVEAGGLISYGVNLNWCYHRAAYYVDKLLKGAKPGDLPVEFPTKIELVINLKTAKVIGITLPRSLLERADEVIE